MPTINRATVCGRLGQEPDFRMTQNNKSVCNLSIATSEKQQDKEVTEWHRCVIWGKYAEVCRDRLRKGDEVLVEGKLKTRVWEDKQGKKNYTTEIHSFMACILRRKEEQHDRQLPNDYQPNEPATPDDIPF